jgi:hypothetical protein
MTIWPKIYLLATLPLALVVLAGDMKPATALSCVANFQKCDVACGSNRPDCDKVCKLKLDGCVECQEENRGGHSEAFCQSNTTQEVNPGSTPPKRRPPVARPGGGTKQQ